MKVFTTIILLVFFTMHGDTIVFNPSAFRLQEGARLDELIKQLLGVEVDAEGKLWWNDKTRCTTSSASRSPTISMPKPNSKGRERAPAS